MMTHKVSISAFSIYDYLTTLHFPIVLHRNSIQHEVNSEMLEFDLERLFFKIFQGETTYHTGGEAFSVSCYLRIRIVGKYSEVEPTKPKFCLVLSTDTTVSRSHLSLLHCTLNKRGSRSHFTYI